MKWREKNRYLEKIAKASEQLFVPGNFVGVQMVAKLAIAILPLAMETRSISPCWNIFGSKSLLLWKFFMLSRAFLVAWVRMCNVRCLWNNVKWRMRKSVGKCSSHRDNSYKWARGTFFAFNILCTRRCHVSVFRNNEFLVFLS